MGLPTNSARVICWFSVKISITSEVIWLDWFHSTGSMYMWIVESVLMAVIESQTAWKSER